MIDFKLDPSSGYADSYTDIQFVVKFPMADKTEISFFNQVAAMDLDILGVDTGHIVQEITAVVENANLVRGYINLFNKDKMNTRLSDYTSVDIKCKVVSIRGEDTSSEEQTVTFYNQSKSLDGPIIPFDLILNSTEVDVESNVPLRMHIICNTAKKYELCIQSDDGKSKCTFEIYTKDGRTTLDLPSEVICSDLELTKNHHKRFQMYWVKFEGVTYQKTMNRKFIPIDNTELHFNAKVTNPMPQDRIGPLGPLSDDFVLSGRYFVHTWRRFSGLGNVVEGYGPRRLNYLTRFMHEAQNMHQVQERVLKTHKTNDMTRDVHKAIRDDALQNRVIRSFPSPKQKEFLTSLSGAYLHRPIRKTEESATVPVKRKESGCGCTRKK